MRRFVLVLLSGLMLSSSAFGWWREGHETIASVADRNLQPSAKKKIESYLGHSIVYFAKWMDDYRHTPEYSFTTHWHMCTVDENLEYLPSPNGDALSGINGAIEALRDYKNQSDSTVAVNIKYLLHLVGDMHCPAHLMYVGRNCDYEINFGGGYIQPKTRVNIHPVWDGLAIQSCRIWSPCEYAQELDRLPRKEIKKITAGTPEQWLRDSAERCLIRFELAPPDAVLAQDFVNAAMPFIEMQMLCAGYRLAHLLNTLF